METIDILVESYTKHQVKVYGHFHINMAHTYRRMLKDESLPTKERKMVTDSIKAHIHTESISPDIKVKIFTMLFSTK